MQLMNITKKQEDGLTYFTLENNQGAQLTVVDYGARLISFKVPTKNGLKEVVVSGTTKKDFDGPSKYFGATIGPVAGRITKGQFTLDGKTYQAATNEGENTLHGGVNSFEWKIFTPEEKMTKDQAALTLSYLREDGMNGFPGNLLVKVTYTLKNSNQFSIHYEGKTDELTVFNPTNHGYFNLTGKMEDISEHTLKINADQVAELKADSMPTGTLLKTAETPFDFREGKKLKEAFSSDHEQIKMKKGIDHPFMFNHAPHTVELTSPDDTLTLKISTDRDAVVIFTSNFGDPVVFEKGPLNFHGAVAIETQNMPDAMNHLGFGNVLLTPEETFESTTTYEILEK